MSGCWDKGAAGVKAWEERERARCRPVWEAVAGMPGPQAGDIELGPEGRGAGGFQRGPLGYRKVAWGPSDGPGDPEGGAVACRGGRNKVRGRGGHTVVCGGLRGWEGASSAAGRSGVGTTPC